MSYQVNWEIQALDQTAGLRLRAGVYRVFYTIEEERPVVQVDHVARLP